MNIETCPRCEKVSELCFCVDLPVLNTRVRVLILQHPQEPDKRLGTAKLASLMLNRSVLKIGLSWPNLRAALGEEVVPSRWAVLYLGSGAKGTISSPFHLVTKDGQALPNAQEVRSQLEGIVVLDGTWSQAKALWWRNAWLLKLRRAILATGVPSMYRELRREPRRECLSTMESVGAALTALGEPPAVEQSLRSTFGTLLERERLSYKANLRNK